MTFSEKVTPVPSKNDASINQDKNKIQRKYSWKLGTRSSFRKRKIKSDLDSEVMPLNNGRNHSQCNGGNVAKQVRINSYYIIISLIPTEYVTIHSLKNIVLLYIMCLLLQTITNYTSHNIP